MGWQSPVSGQSSALAPDDKGGKGGSPPDHGRLGDGSQLTITAKKLAAIDVLIGKTNLGELG